MKTSHILLISAVVFSAGVLLGTLLSADRQPVQSGAVVQPNTTATTAEQAQKSQTSLLADAVTVESEELRLLQQHTSELEQQLATRQEMLEAAEQQLQMDSAEIAEIAETKRTPALSSLSLEQTQLILPEPFAGLMSKQKGQAVDFLNQHQQESVDSEWAYTMELNIQDHFATHEHASHVKLASVSCKTSLCEIRGYEYDADVFLPIYNAMQTRDWWRYSSSYGFQGSNQQGRFFYVLVELKR